MCTSGQTKLKIILEGQIFDGSDDSCPPSSEHSKELIAPDLPILSAILSSLSGDSSSDDKNVSDSDLATNKDKQVGVRLTEIMETKKRCATKLLKIMNLVY